MTKAVKTWARVLYWAGLLLAVLTLLTFSDRPDHLWAAAIVAIVFWGGALTAVVLENLGSTTPDTRGRP